MGAKQSLHDLIRESDINKIRRLLDRGRIDINEQDFNWFRRTPLHVAIFEQSSQQSVLAKILIEKGADVNIKERQYGYTALHIAAQQGRDETALALLSCGRLENINEKADGDSKKTALQVAILEKKESVAKILIENEADVNIKESLFGYTALHLAAIRDLEETTLALLGCGRLENIDEKAEGNDNSTPLHVAIVAKSESVAKILIENGADVNMKQLNGKTALHLAAYFGHDETTLTLLSCGRLENINEKDGGDYNITPLQVAIRFKNESVAKILIEKGADVHVSDLNGKNAIHYVCEYGCKNLLEMIWPNICKEDLNVPDRNNYTPLTLAIACYKDEIVQFLIENGVDVNYEESVSSPIWHAVNSENLFALELISKVDDLNFEERSLDGLTPLELALAKGFEKAIPVFARVYERKYKEAKTVWKKCLQFDYAHHIPYHFDPDIEEFDDFGIKCIQSQSSESLQWLRNWLKSKSPTEQQEQKLKQIFNFDFGGDSDTLRPKFPYFNEAIENKSEVGSFRNEQFISLSDVVDKVWLRQFCCISTSKDGETISLKETVLRECKSSCEKKDQCKKVRLLVEVSQLIESKLPDSSSLMEVLKPKFFLVGSIAEGTRLFSASEIDVSAKLQGLEENPLEMEHDAMKVFVPETLRETFQDYLVRNTNEFNYLKFLNHFLECVVRVLRQVSIPKDLHLLSLDFKPCIQCKGQGNGDKFAHPSHCKKCAPTVTYTKIGACLIFKHKKEFLNMDLVLLFPIRIKGHSKISSVELINRVILTCIDKSPENWLSYLRKNLFTRDLILVEDLHREADKRREFQLVAMKLLHYGNKNNFIILPAQQLKVAKLNENNLRMIYSYMKALKDLLDIPVKSYIIKKLIISPQFFNQAKDENPSQLNIQRTLFNACNYLAIRKHFFSVIDEAKWREAIEHGNAFDRIPLKEIKS